MTNEKVSILIPVYNSEKFLKESIESALNQTYDDVEIIVINDGSQDNSLNILKKFEDKIILIDQKNNGLSSAANTGIKNMTGNWFKWLSPDDVLTPDSVSALVSQAKVLPKNTILYSNWEIIDEDGKKLRNFNESNYNDLENFDFNVRLLDGQQININTVLFPSILFEKGCLFQTLDDTTLIDYDYFLRAGILYNFNFHLVEKNLLRYRIHSNQTSHQNIIKSLKSLEDIKHNVLELTENETKSQYQESLKKYTKDKQISKKIMDDGLKLISTILPEKISNQMLIFYLNKIRSGR